MLNHFAVLVVDDDRDILELVGEQVIQGGHRVVAVGSAVEAVELMRTIVFDVVVSDWRMVDINGLELFAKVRTAGPVGMILMTAFPEEMFFRTAHGDRDDVCLIAKPFTADALLKLIDEVGAMAKTRRQLLQRRAPELP